LPSSNLRGNNKKLLRVFDKKRRKQQQKKKNFEERTQKEEKKEEQKERKTEGGLSISPWLSTVVRALLINQQKLIFFAFIVKILFVFCYHNVWESGLSFQILQGMASRLHRVLQQLVGPPPPALFPSPVQTTTSHQIQSGKTNQYYVIVRSNQVKQINTT
jgi:hypothetical protein